METKDIEKLFDAIQPIAKEMIDRQIEIEKVLVPVCDYFTWCFMNKKEIDENVVMKAREFALVAGLLKEE